MYFDSLRMRVIKGGHSGLESKYDLLIAIILC